MLASVAIEHIQKNFESETVGIAYVYCNFREKRGLTAEALFAGLLKQLVQSKPTCPEGVVALFESHARKETKISLAEAKSALRTVAASYSRVMLVVDALDECDMGDGNRATFLSGLFDLQRDFGVNLLATSRFITEIQQQFQESVSLEIRASEHDIQRYVDGCVPKLPAFVSRNKDLQDEIKAQITKVVDGM